MFADPIPFRSSSNSINNVPITLFGQNWTIINYKLPNTGTWNNVTSHTTNTISTETVSGGELSLASTLQPEKTVYVGQNYSTGGANNFTVQVADIGQPNSSGISPAALKVYYNGVLYNTTAVSPGATKQFNDSGHNLYVKVYQTFAGLYAYEKYAKIQLYSNVVNVTSNKEFNTTYDKGWTTELLWTNSSSTPGPANELQSIIVVNSTPTHLTPGQSFDFIGNPKAFKLTFEQPTFGSGTYNPVTLSTSETGSVEYQNLGTTSTANTPLNITEPAQELTVSAPSSLSNAFEVAGVPSSSVMYDLTPYAVNTTTINTANVPITVTFANTLDNLITSSHTLQVTLKGLTSTGGTATPIQVTFKNNFGTSNTLIGSNANIDMAVVTNVTLSEPMPGITVAVSSANVLTTAAPEIMYLKSGQSNYYLTSGSSINFNQNNGETPSFTLSDISSPKAIGSTGPYAFYTYTMNEYPVPFNTTAVDSFGLEIANATSGGPTATFDLNYSLTNTHDNVTYTTNTQNSLATSVASFPVKQGFYSERGSEVSSISPGSVTINFAKGVDMLNFVVSPYNITAVSKSFKTVGPVGIGQPVPNVPNVTVASVTANISVSDVSGATVTGISNLTAIPSVSSATTPVLLKNLTTSPLVVLNSTANPSSNLILIGSGFVNGLSAQVQAANNVTFTPTSAPVLQAFGSNRVLIAGYYANQTTAEANAFIQDLYASASTS